MLIELKEIIKFTLLSLKRQVMERIKSALSENKRLLTGGLIASTALLGIYYATRKRTNTFKLFKDADFSLPNLPLYATEALKRDQILSNVTYDLVLALSKNADTYEGRLRTSFTVKSAKTPSFGDLFLDFQG